jgi:glycosyltransferase involved in cell wall biosynthesis
MLSELFYPHGSGGELATYLYAELLRKTGINVVVVTNRFSGEPEVSRSENLIVYRLPLFNETKGVKYLILRRFDILISGFMKKLMKWADIVYIPKFWFSAIPFAKACKKPVIVHLHGYHPICPLSVLYDLSKNRICQRQRSVICSLKCIMTDARKKTTFPKVLELVALNFTARYYIDRFVRLSDSIICVSKAQERLIIEHFPSMAKKIHMIYNPLPEVVDFDGRVGDFGYFGGPSILKGFNVVCQALRKVNPKIKIHFTKMPKMSADLFDGLRQLGIIAYETLPGEIYKNLYKQIQVVVVPSVWCEPWGYTVSEALLSRRLVIASSVGGIPEQVEGLEGAFLFQPGNSEQLADQIANVRDLSEEVKAELGFKNKEKFLTKFDNEKTLRNFISVLEKVS